MRLSAEARAVAETRNEFGNAAGHEPGNAASRGIGGRIDKSMFLVLGVARFGEADLRGWWGGHGLSRTGRFVLGRAFPRTSAQVGLELDILSAQRRHDEALAGRRNALHLFSDELPFRRRASSWLSAQKTTTTAARIFDELAGWDIRAAEAWIRDLADTAKPVGTPVSGEVIADGLRLGTVSRADIEDAAESCISANPANADKADPAGNAYTNPDNPDNSAKPDNKANPDNPDPDDKGQPRRTRPDRVPSGRGVHRLGSGFQGTVFRPQWLRLRVGGSRPG